MLIEIPEVRVPSPSDVEKCLLSLTRRLGDSKVLTEVDACANYAIDESEVVRRTPNAVVLASSTEDIARTLEIAEACDVPVTPRAGGTGRSGGAVPVAGGIVLATHGMSDLKEIHTGDLVAVVGPGMITGEFHALVEKEGLFYPPDPNSLASCMLGGNVAENSSGPRSFKYGATRDYVLGLSAVLMGGHVHRVGHRTTKGVTGYDVTSLLVGSEGTLGVFSELTLRLVPNPPKIATAMALFESVHAAGDAVSRVVRSGLVPRCMELLDAATLEAVRKHSGANVAIDPRAGAMLLLEVDGTGLDEELEQIAEVMGEVSGLLDVVAAQDASQRARLWTARRALSPATKKLAKYKLSEDIVVPRSQIGELLRRVDGIGEETGVRHLTYGHAGDGILHVNFLWNDDSERPAVDRALTLLMQHTVALSGTLSGEHGIGITKAKYLPIEQPSALVALQKDLKRVFDPKGLLNPGKIFPAGSHGGC